MPVPHTDRSERGIIFTVVANKSTSFTFLPFTSSNVAMGGSSQRPIPSSPHNGFITSNLIALLQTICRRDTYLGPGHLLQNNSVQFVWCAVKLPRRDLKILVGLLTGHYILNWHLTLLCGEEYERVWGVIT